MANSKGSKPSYNEEKTRKSSRKSGGFGKNKSFWGLVAILIAISYWLVSEGMDFLSNKIPTPNPDPIEEDESLYSNWNNMDLSSLNFEKQARPKTVAPYAEQLISHKAYSLSYNKDFKVPNWVFYELTREEIKGTLERSNNFQEDPNIKYKEASHLDDYRRSGWDRGHMAPSMDMNWDEEVLDESYLLSNMCPQGHDFNSGIWLDLEHQVRYWAKRDSAVCVVCGPVLPRSNKQKIRTLGEGKVLIPDYFYKVVFAPFASKPRAIAFIMPNEQKNEKISSFAVTVDSVETLTGIDFFPILPDVLEEKVESSLNLRDWFRKKDI